MIERKPNTQRFKEKIDQVSTMYKEAFAGFPWFDTPILEQLQTERGKKLADFVRKLCETVGINDLVWERELIVRPDYQRQKIATRLRMTFCLIFLENTQKGSLS